MATTSGNQAVWCGACLRDIIEAVPFYMSTALGFFLGFGFGAGCALAVMYSIFLCGYRAALRDCEMTMPPKRLIQARSKLVPKQG